MASSKPALCLSFFDSLFFLGLLDDTKLMALRHNISNEEYFICTSMKKRQYNGRKHQSMLDIVL